MDDLEGPLRGLVRRLDALRPEPTLINLARAVEAAALTPADVARFVRETPGRYHRGLVVRREHYELLVLTWTAGQGSAPHDHAGSVSAMGVVAGTAAEGSWRIGEDGYVDLQFETTLAAGELTAWQDAGVHTIRNASPTGETLVTVHVYAPPLKDFRLYAVRPEASPAAPKTTGEAAQVVVVGGGFSGATTAAQILRQASEKGAAVQVTLVERQGSVGEGLAYSTRDPAHLLNVPAGRMSAWPDRPDDFVQWLARRGTPVAATDFLPRKTYGEYVRETLVGAARDAAPNVRLTVLFDEVRRLARRPGGGWVVNLARGASLTAAATVLAIGHRPPPDPIGRYWSGPRARYIADPWKAFATSAIEPDQPVLVLGTGLTAVDAVLSLFREPRSAPVTLLSRRGLAPQSHASPAPPPADLQPLAAEMLATPGGVKVHTLFQRLRKLIAEGVAAGKDWRSFVDGLRPHTAALWRATPVEERQRFLARLRPFWEVHRHRMAVAVAERFHALVASGQVRMIAGSVASAQADDEGVRLYVRERGDHRLLEMHAAWVLNCTGPAASNSAESNPAVGSLLVHGWIRPDELSLGLETTPDGAAIDARGAAAPDLFVVGTLRKPGLWESTAAPELRAQAAAVAERIVGRLPGRPNA